MFLTICFIKALKTFNKHFLSSLNYTGINLFKVIISIFLKLKNYSLLKNLKCLLKSTQCFKLTKNLCYFIKLIKAIDLPFKTLWN